MVKNKKNSIGAVATRTNGPKGFLGDRTTPARDCVFTPFIFKQRNNFSIFFIFIYITTYCTPGI